MTDNASAVEGKIDSKPENSFGIGEDDVIASKDNNNISFTTTTVIQQQQVQSTQGQQQQQHGDLATANRLLKGCRVLIDQLNKQLAAEKEENAKVKEEFQKYRVRVELARKNSELEISNLSEVNLKFKQYNVVSHDALAELEMLRRRFESVEKDRSDAAIEINHLSRVFNEEKAQRARLEEELREWKKKAEVVGPEFMAQAKTELNEEVNNLRKEFRMFRERTAKALEEKDAEIVRARTGTEATTELAYLRDVLIKYLASTNDAASRTSMEAAIATVLRFNQSEMSFIKDKRRSDLGWKRTFPSLGM